ncbi:MAG: putative molybdenum carrier protein [Myxococcota bacterium]
MARRIRVISGGQTGVDRAALLAAQACGLECGGWCPPGRASESGTIPLDFPLKETPQERSPRAPDLPRSLRTEWNVRDSDATLILRPSAAGSADPGTDWTAACAAHYGRACLVCDPADPAASHAISEWLDAATIRTLNVAGPSEAACPGIEERAYTLLLELLSR